MASLAEILSSPEALEQAADEIARMSEEHDAPEDDMNTGIRDAEEMLAILDGICGSDEPDYSRFCRIGRGDF